MAYLPNQQQDEEDQPHLYTGAGGGGVPGAGGGQGSAAPAQDSGSGFPALMGFLNANQGQGQQMGQAARDHVGQDVNYAKTAVGALTDRGTAAARGGAIAPATEHYGESGNSSKLADDGNAYWNGLKNDSKGMDYLNGRAGYSYAGPKDLSGVDGYQGAMDAVGQAEGGIKRLGTSGGVQSLLSDAYGAPASKYDAQLAGTQPTYAYPNLRGLIDQGNAEVGGTAKMVSDQGAAEAAGAKSYLDKAGASTTPWAPPPPPDYGPTREALRQSANSMKGVGAQLRRPWEILDPTRWRL